MHRCHLFEKARFVSHERFREWSFCLFPSPGALALEMLVHFSFDGIIASIIEKVGSHANVVMALFHVLFLSIIASFFVIFFLRGKVKPVNRAIGIIRSTQMIKKCPCLC